METFPGPLVCYPCRDSGRTPSEGLGGPLRRRVTRGKSSRPPGGSPWVGLGGTRLWIERLVTTPSACAGACCSRAGSRSTSYGRRTRWLKYALSFVCD